LSPLRFVSSLRNGEKCLRNLPCKSVHCAYVNHQDKYLQEANLIAARSLFYSENLMESNSHAM